jgi:DNA-binding NarL/FixJ family response regulator
MKKLHILLADDQVLFVESLKRVIETVAKDMVVVAVAHDGSDAIDLAIKHKPDLILMDVRMPNTDGVEATRVIKENLPSIHIIMLTTFDDDEYVQEALRFGAVGYLLKDISPIDLISSIRAISESSFLLSPRIVKKLLLSPHNKIKEEQETKLGGGAASIENLSRREKEILDCILEGLSNKEIAERLYVSEPTIRNHVSSIYSKLGENKRYKLINKLKRL